jgi:hypothetical protein
LVLVEPPFQARVVEHWELVATLLFYWPHLQAQVLATSLLLVAAAVVTIFLPAHLEHPVILAAVAAAVLTVVMVELASAHLVYLDRVIEEVLAVIPLVATAEVEAEALEQLVLMLEEVALLLKAEMGGQALLLLFRER